MVRHLRVLLFAAIEVVTLGVTGIHREPRADQTCAASPDAEDEDATFLEPRECQLVKDYPQIVRRADDRLLITTKSGDPIIFQNDYSGCHADKGVCESFRLYALYLDEGIAVVDKGSNESSWGVLVDLRLGSQVLLDSIPSKSPDGSYWAVAVEPGLNSFPNIQVAERIEGELTRVADHIELQAGVENECTFLEWRAKDSFAVVCPKRNSAGEWSNTEFLIQRLAPGKWAPVATGRNLTDSEYERLFQP